MKVILVGYGQMGQKLAAAFQNNGDEIVQIISLGMTEKLPAERIDADILVDFSHPDNLADILNYANKYPLPLLLATTGYSSQQLAAIQEASCKMPVFQSYNTSFGISMLLKMAREYSRDFYDASFDIEILEKHHNRKVDAPSGTAMQLANAMKENIPELTPVYDRQSVSKRREHSDLGISSIRGGTIFGEHTIYFAGPDEIFEIKHTALSRDVFVNGALKAAYALVKKPSGLYGLNNLYE